MTRIRKSGSVKSAVASRLLAIYRFLTGTHDDPGMRRSLAIGLTLVAALVGTTAATTATLASETVERKVACAPSGRVSQESRPMASRDGRTLAWSSGFWRRGDDEPYRPGVVQQVFVSAPDGSNVRRVSASGNGYDTVDAIAPDGSQVLIRSNSWILASTRRAESRVITPAERGEIRRQWRTSEWSPDGRYRVEADYPHQRLLVVPADGGPVREIATPGIITIDAAWSPGGQQILIEAEDENGHDLYLVRADGTGLRRLTGSGNAGGPAWSPNGSWIAYSINDTDVHSGVSIAVIRTDGKRWKKLAGGLDGADRRSAYAVAWIDARKLVFDSRQYRKQPNRVADIHTIRSDGRGERRITYECHLGTRRADRISGSLLADTIRAFSGDDEIAAGAGVDDVDAGPGADSIRTIDRARDTVRCGPGRDTVVADRRDRIGRDCERVSRNSR